MTQIEKINKKIQDFFEGLVFEEESHKYTIKGVKIKKSVSKLIEDFHEKFDSEKAALAYSKKYNIPVEDVLKSWSDSGKKACDLGHKTHLFGENFVKDRSLKPTSGFEQAIVNFWDDLPDFIVPVKTECIMYHKKFLWAGTADILLYNKKTNKFIIADYKTNKSLFKNFKEKKMNGVFSNLLLSPFNKYQLQLSFYQLLLEQITDIEVSHRKIIWVKDDENYQIYDCENFTEQLENHYNEK